MSNGTCKSGLVGKYPQAQEKVELEKKILPKSKITTGERGEVCFLEIYD